MSGLRLARLIAALHELVEFGLVLGFAQLLQEVQEFAVLILKPLQRFLAIGVKGGVAVGAAKP